MKYFLVAKEEHGLTLLAFLKRHCLSDFSSIKDIKRSIEARSVTVNGKVELFASHLLAYQDKVEIHLQNRSSGPPSVSILYEDDHLVICNKSAGVVSEVGQFQGLKKGKYLELVHRLDKDTSGVLVLAKNEKARLAMKALFSKRAVEKVYFALVDGLVDKREGTIDNFLGKKGECQGQTLYGKVKEEVGQRAVTYWKCIERGERASLVLCRPLTGRTHQLRVHLKEMGHPILGDYQYAKDFLCSKVFPRHLLHAYAIGFIHPFTQKNVLTVAPFPEDFIKAAKHLKVCLHDAYGPASWQEGAKGSQV